MRGRFPGGAWTAAALVLCCSGASVATDRLQVAGPPGKAGGRLVAALRFELRTFNWLVSTDAASREVTGLLMADLIHINRLTQKTEPALAKSWKVSADGLHWTLELRHGVRFSDGQPFDADDVVFTFQAIYDERTRSPQRDLLLLGGRPIEVRKLDAFHVAFDLPKARAVADRLFDGVYILPRHLLEGAWKAGKLSTSWNLSTPPAEIAGLGPFRIKSHSPGQQVALERNPFYWKQDSAGQILPYLDEVRLIVAGSEDNQVLRFQAGETDVISRVGARNFNVLQQDQARRGIEMRDLGSSMEVSVLVFNLGEASPDPAIAAHQRFLRRKAFRQAVSAAIDREAIVKLVYTGRASSLSGLVPPGNRAWINQQLPPARRSLERARQLLREDGFSWKNGELTDPDGGGVVFTIIVSNSNPERQQMAAMIQDDLKSLGMRVQIVPLDFGSLADSLQRTRRFEAAMLSFPTPDADPNPDLPTYLSSGGNHLWNPSQKTPGTAWEQEIDSLMRRQQITLKYPERKKLFDRVQQIMADYQPMIPLVSPSILVGAKKTLGNFQPAVLDPFVTWNAEQLYWGAGSDK